MTSLSQCRSQSYEFLDSLTSAALPVSVPQLSSTAVPYAAQEAEVLSAPPVEPFVAGGIAIAAIFVGANRCVAKYRAARVALRTTAITAATTGAALMIAWGALHLAQADAETGNYETALNTMQRMEHPFEYLAWVSAWKENPVTLLAENAAYSGIRNALAKDDAKRSLHFVSYPVARSPEGRLARSAAFTANARAELISGHLGKALTFAEHAVEADPGSEEATRNVYVARAHLAFAAVERAGFVEAKHHLGAIDQSWNPSLYVSLLTRIAHDESIHLLNTKPDDLFKADSTNLATADGILESALSTTRTLGRQSAALECSLGAVLQARAIQSYDAKQYGDAIQLLTRQETVLTGSEATNVLFADSLMGQGADELRAGNADAAIGSFEWALQRDAARAARIHPLLSDAYVLRSATQREARELDAALTSATRARELSPTQLTEDNLTMVHFAKADRALSLGNWTLATSELLTVRVNPRFEAQSNFRLGGMQGADSRIGNINRMLRWATTRQVCGELAEDLNADRVVDVYVYTDCGGAPAGWMSVNDRSQVIFVEPGKHEVVRGLLYDSDRDGRFDLWQRPGSGNGAFNGIRDNDGDGLPDVTFIRTSTSLQETPLSGRILIRVLSGVIASESDLLSRPDPYFNIWQNRQHIYRSPTIPNTRYPVFNSGAPIQYRYGDVVTIELKDEDVLWENEPIGHFSWNQLPVSGRYVTSNKQAALEIAIEPSKLPPGFRFQGPPVRNGFQFAQDLPMDSPIKGVIARAEQADTRGEIYSFLAQTAVSELAVALLVPRANFAVQLLVGMAASQLVAQ